MPSDIRGKRRNVAVTEIAAKHALRAAGETEAGPAEAQPNNGSALPKAVCIHHERSRAAGWVRTRTINHVRYSNQSP